MGDEPDGVIGWIREIVLDSPDPWSLARFWAGLLGGTPVEWYPGWVTLEPPPHGQRLSFQGTSAGTGAGSVADPGPAADADSAAATGYRSVPLVHFDVLVSELSQAHERAVAAGATFIGEHVSPRPGQSGEPVRWRVYQDTAGHQFCLVSR